MGISVGLYRIEYIGCTKFLGCDQTVSSNDAGNNEISIHVYWN